MIIYKKRQRKAFRATGYGTPQSTMEQYTVYSMYVDYADLVLAVQEACEEVLEEVAFEGEYEIRNTKFYKGAKKKIAEKIYDAVSKFVRSEGIDEDLELNRFVLIFTEEHRNQLIVDLGLSMSDLLDSQDLNNILNRLIGYFMRKCFMSERLEMVMYGESKFYRISEKYVYVEDEYVDVDSEDEYESEEE